MATQYGDFPGVRVTVAGGGITSVSIGEEEKLVLVGAADYDASTDEVTGSADANEIIQINARGEADTFFGEGSELANSMKEALANGASMDFLYGVAPERIAQTNEVFDNTASANGVLDNYPIVEDTSTIEVGGTVEFRYDGAPATPTEDDTVYINPFTGEYAVTSGSVTNLTAEIDYKYLDWVTALEAVDAEQTIAENETGIIAPLTEADSLSGSWTVQDADGNTVTSMEEFVATLRDHFRMANIVHPAEPNDNETRDGTAYAHYDSANYDTANQSADADYYFKFASARLYESKSTITGGFTGVYAGNSLSNPIYNDPITGYGELEQRLTRTDAQNFRTENIIPVRQNGSIRIKDNLSTSTADDQDDTEWERDLWRRRITDRVILIAKEVGDSILGEINDEDTRETAARQIRQEIRALVGDRLLKPNTSDETNWFVDVYVPSDAPPDTNQVNIDLGFTPYGIVKEVETTVTIRV